jgi:hypothetical protein
VGSRNRSRQAATLGAVMFVAITMLVGTGASALASNRAATSSEPTQTVVLALTPRDPAGLHQLAQDAHSLPLAERRARLPQVLAGSDRAALVASRAQELGFTVTATDETSVTLTGPASLVTASFGSARQQDETSPVGQALPAMPSSFRGFVTVAAGGDETRPVRKPLGLTQGPKVGSPTALTQSDLRQLYAIPGTPAQPTSNSPTIATLQFSNWTPNDLTQYAQSTGVYGNTIYDPVTGGGYSAVTVSGGATDSVGAAEVSLDQSALATVAPQFRQRAYFAPNNALGQSQALNRISAEASTQKIVAISTSWGLCEADAYNGNPGLLQTDQQAIDAVVAAGIPIFAASGDSGAFDCHNSTSLAVDTPASFPEVIGVGGTSVTKSGSSYTEKAWGSSGGGYSKLFCADSSQAAALPAAANNFTCATGKARGVPDIAMDADPGTGLTIYVGGTPSTFGGTSLSAPLAGGSFAATMLSAGTLTGDHDVQTWLYSAQSTAAMSDITTGTEGSGRVAGGWDPITGIGTPRWSALSQRAVMGGTVGLPQNWTLTSANQLFKVVFQGDGNLVLYGPQGALWNSGTNGRLTASFFIQSDGNLVIYDGGQAVWNSRTNGHSGGVVLAVGDDGTLGLLQDGQALWKVPYSINAPSGLVPGEFIVSPDRRTMLVMQGDGNLVLYSSDGRALWNSHTNGNAGATLALQADGNLVIYRDSVPLWWTGTQGVGPAPFLVVQSDGNVVLYRGTLAIWNTQTRN